MTIIVENVGMLRSKRGIFWDMEEEYESKYGFS
jgi:hypothetical protein